MAAARVDTKVLESDFCQQSSLAATTDVDIMPSECSQSQVIGAQRRRNLGDQLELDRGPQSKIRDGSTVRKALPHRTAVFDFRFRSPYEP